MIKTREREERQKLIKDRDIDIEKRGKENKLRNDRTKK